MLKRYLFIILFLLLQFSGFTQNIPDSNFIDIARIIDSTSIINKTLLFIDSNNVAGINNITQQKFVPFETFNYRKFIRPHLITKTVYLQFGVFNKSNLPDTFYLYPGPVFDKIDTYKKNAGNILTLSSSGTTPGFCFITLNAMEKAEFITVLKYCRQDYNLLRPQLIKAPYLYTYKKIYGSKDEGIKLVGFVLSGILLMMILFTIVNYILTGKKEFLYYLGYVVATFLLVFFYALLKASSGSLSSFFNGYADLFLLITGNVFYLAFSRHFLNTKNKYLLLDKIFKVVELFLLGLLLAFTLIHYFTNWYLTERFLENAMKFVSLGIGIFFIVIAFKQKERLMIYLATGSAFAIIFSGISLTIILLRIPTTGIFDAALFYHEVGLVFALSFFLLGLTYKNRKELIERTQEQEALKLDVEKKVLENQIDIIKAQQEERNRISADMHDDLGAGMTTIRLYSELAKNRLGDNTIPEIEKISSSANELLNKMNAIIWSMSSSNDSLGNMIAYIRSYSLEYFEGSGINCRITIPQDLPNIVVSGEIRRNVFLVVKEALNNILKHSKATEVIIILERVPDGLKLFIQDNGVGIDFEKLRQFGNGLKNMKKRMDDIDVNFSIENKNGTLVTLHRIVTTF